MYSLSLSLSLHTVPEATGAATVTITNAGPRDIIYAVENGPAMIDCAVSPPFPTVNVRRPHHYMKY